jgi:ubiquinone/menaquinone biosynthesis C-methylase UbiE
MSILYSARFFPNIYVSQNPFKILEYQHLMDLTEFSGAELVLDWGCGSGLQTLLLAEKARKVIGLDIRDLSKAEKKARRVEGRLNVKFLQGRMQDSPFPDGMFDKVFCICVLEHIPEYREVLQECFNLLKDDGELLLSVDSLAGLPPDLVDKHAKDHSVSHYFDAEELQELLSAVMFQEVKVHPIMRSKFAKWMFCNGIRGGFSYTVQGAMARWLALSVSEFFCPKREEGIFLLARGRK